jgi:hypothetical protein
MKSLIANLRELTLPFGATTGARIVLDGATGTILMYDTNGDLFFLIEPTLGLVFVDPDLDTRLQLGADSGNFTVITFRDSDGDKPARLYYGPIPGANDYRFITLQSPEVESGPYFLRALLLSPLGTTKNPLFQVDTGFLNPSGAQPIIDLTGYIDTLEAVVVAADYRIGSSNGSGNAPTIGNPLPKGAIAYAFKDTNTTLSTTAGTWTDVIETADAPVEVDHVYMVTMSGSYDLVTGGSGFATSDTWEYKLQRSLNSGGSWQDVGGRQIIARAWVATGFRYIVPPFVRLYTPSTDAPTVRWKVVARKAAGAATVTSVIETLAAECPYEILVEDCGAP